MKNLNYLLSLSCLLLTLSLLPASAQTVPALINYQGQLTNPDGSPLITADYELTFNLYDSATAGNLVWGPQKFDGQSGLGHGPRIPVVQGYFNVMLGPVDTTDRSLLTAFMGTNRFVQVTISNRAPIMPRQQILSAPYAINASQADNSSKLAGYDWSGLLDTNNPVTGSLLGSKIRDGSISAGKIQPGTITSNQIAPQTITGAQIANVTITSQQLAGAIITSNQIAPGSITAGNIAPGGVALTNLAPRQVGQNVGVGGIAVSIGSGDLVLPTSSDIIDITNLNVTITVTGRPVLLCVLPDVFTSTNVQAQVGTQRLSSANDYSAYGQLYFCRDGSPINSGVNFGSFQAFTGVFGILASPTFTYFDSTPSPGLHTYSIKMRKSTADAVVFLQNVRLVVFEL
jgi:hypothetical protein